VLKLLEKVEIQKEKKVFVQDISVQPQNLELLNILVAKIGK
jgi:hypothetical protein